MRVTPSDLTPAELVVLRALLDRSTQTATPAVADSVAYPARQMSAAEFVEFWRSVRLVAMATVGPAAQPHIAPVHPSSPTTLRLRIYEDTVRRQDLAANPRVAFTTWRADGAVAILYGRAREAPGSLRPARPGQSGRPRRAVTIEVRLTRIYAMRAPESESNLTAQAWIRISDPAVLSDLRDFFRRWGCIRIETSRDTVQALVPEPPSEREGQLEIRTCLDAWLARHPRDHPWRSMPHHGMTPPVSGSSLSAQARYAAGVREILECWFDARPIREEYLIVDRGTLAGAGAHSYSAGDATGGSDEAARFKDRSPGRAF